MVFFHPGGPETDKNHVPSQLSAHGQTQATGPRFKPNFFMDVLGLTNFSILKVPLLDCLRLDVVPTNLILSRRAQCTRIRETIFMEL